MIPGHRADAVLDDLALDLDERRDVLRILPGQVGQQALEVEIHVALAGLGLQHVLITNGVSLLQTNKYNSTCWPSCHGHALPPRWLKACNPARNGGAHDHSGVYHGVVL